MKGQPFFFDKHIFEDDTPVLTKEEEEAPLEFTREDLTVEKDKAFEEGRKAGVKEAEDGKVQKLIMMLQGMEKNLSTLSNAEKERMDLYESEATLLSFAIFNKLFPVLNKLYGLDEMKEALRDSLSHQHAPDTISIQLNESTSIELKTYLDQLGDELSKNFSIETTSDLNDYEFRMTWPEGGMINNRHNIAQKASELIIDALAERNINVHDSKYELFIEDDEDDLESASAETDQIDSEYNETGDQS